jgi:hypothetical protein
LARKKKERGFGGTFDNVGGWEEKFSNKRDQLTVWARARARARANIHVQVILYKFFFFFTKVILYKYIIQRNCCYALQDKQN